VSLSEKRFRVRIGCVCHVPCRHYGNTSCIGCDGEVYVDVVRKYQFRSRIYNFGYTIRVFDWIMANLMKIFQALSEMCSLGHYIFLTSTQFSRCCQRIFVDPSEEFFPHIPKIEVMFSSIDKYRS
jgi:hypothetical protein